MAASTRIWSSRTRTNPELDSAPVDHLRTSRRGNHRHGHRRGCTGDADSSVSKNPNRGAHNLHWAVGPDNGQNLGAGPDRCGRRPGTWSFCSTTISDPTAGTPSSGCRPRSSVVSYTLVDPSTYASFVTDSQRDTDTSTNSWNPAAFTPGGAVGQSTASRDRVTVFADLDHDGASDDMLGRVTSSADQGSIRGLSKAGVDPTFCS